MQQFERLGCENAVGPATVRDDFNLLGEARELTSEFAQRHRQCARNVAGRILFTRANVEYDQVLFPRQQLRSSDRFKLVAFLKVVAHDKLDFGETLACQIPERQEKAANLLVSQAIEHPGAISARSDKPRFAQDLQMCRCVGHSHRGRACENLDTPLALAQ